MLSLGGDKATEKTAQVSVETPIEEAKEAAVVTPEDSIDVAAHSKADLVLEKAIVAGSDSSTDKAIIEAPNEQATSSADEAVVVAVMDTPAAVVEVSSAIKDKKIINTPDQSSAEALFETPAEETEEVTVEVVTKEAVESVIEVPTAVLAESSGEKDFQALCGSCHAVDGTGNGERSSGLKNQPSDLTILAQKNDGHFPYVKVRKVIDGRVGEGYYRAHRKGDMPVWGDVFSREKGNSAPGQLHARAATKMRILDLVDYLVTIQK